MTTITRHKLAGVLHLASDLTVDPISGTVTIDDSWSPYIQITMLCHAPASAILETINPRSQQRGTVTVTEEWATSPTDVWNSFGYKAPLSRAYDVLLTKRVIDDTTGELTLTLESDEALLQGYKHPVTASERTYGLSIKTAVQYALGKIGAALAGGDDDANLLSKPLTPVRTNLMTNPGADVDLTGAVGTSVTLTRDTAWSSHGAASYKMTAAASTDSFFEVGGGSGAIRLGMAAGKTYRVSGVVHITAPLTGSGAARRLGLYAAYRVGTGGYVETVVQAPNVAGTYRLDQTVSLPSGTTEAWFRFYDGDTGTVWWDDLMLTEGSDLLDFFDGSTIDGLYTFAWTGTAGKSTSTRTNVPNSDATIWKPGVSAWDWLTPMLQAGNLRLWCDEARNWHLKSSWLDSSALVTLSPGTSLKTAVDTVDIQNQSSWYDHVVIHYSWNDAANVSQEAWDTATSGTALSGLVLDYPDTVYPGPGAAAYVLSRGMGRGRVFEVTAISDYVPKPGMPLSLSVPGAPIQTGVVSAVAWSFPEDTMAVTSKGLTDTPLGAWALAVGTWAAATGTWAAATGTN